VNVQARVASGRAAAQDEAQDAAGASVRPRRARATSDDAGALVAAGPRPASSVRLQPGDELELEVGALAYGGEGVARLGEEGYVVFVAGAVPGDRVRAQVYKRKRAYAHARAVELLRPSGERIPERADHPGVPWQVLAYERQLEIKREQIEDALARIGRLGGYELEQTIPAQEQWRYRNKLEYSFGHGPGGELLCGFHAPARWNRVVHIEDCLLASAQANRARQVAYEWCRGERLRAWERSVRRARGRGASAAKDDPDDAAATPDPGPPRPLPDERRTGIGRADERTGPGPDGRALLRNLVVREGRRTGMLLVRLVTTRGELDGQGFAQALVSELGEGALSGVLWTRSEQLGETTAGGETKLLWGERELPERMCGLDVRIPPEAFFQTNTEMAEALYAVAGQYAALTGRELVFDLYSGLGTIALSLARGAREVWGLEVSAEAVAGAQAAARRNGVENGWFRAGEVRRSLRELVRAAGRPEVVIVDPPRAGLGRKVTERVIEAAPGRIVYVSCNPTTLAADAAWLAQAGWSLRRVRPVDMFPQTHHIECVALLERGAACRRGPGGGSLVQAGKLA
jgi:23S rRNA (uracil1939-C5)-methyltransferase